MDRETELAIIRRAYAKQVLAVVGVRDPRIEAAYATVRREDFLGPGPWQFFRWVNAYIPSPDADPVYLYTDDVIGIAPERGINNGQPSLHAALIAKATPREGDHVVHVGAGVGYYTAILAHLVGPSGHVTGIEFEADLAARARANFSGASNVEIIQGDGALVPFPAANIIYVNAGANYPAPAWLDGLADGGRLILPLTTEMGLKEVQVRARRGAVFCIERRGVDYLAEWISPVAIFPCAGNHDPASEAALAAAFDQGQAQKVRRLYRRDDIAPDRCWVRASGWCLAYA
ncbi:MAG TPA: rRNA adenine N-6-methyltransferase family protein [Steroidobacteraceae bacterium]|nr:rRNA adenine N-6-methyltransferase family protein [Steroidobacteraceae bacterium]